jgi:hypothetical protein
MALEPRIALSGPPSAFYTELEEWQAWYRRHGLDTAAEGGVFPRVFIRRWGDEVEISWRSHGLVGVPRGFTFAAPTGVARFPVTEVADVMRRALAEASDELDRRFPTSHSVARLNATLAHNEDLDAIGLMALHAGLKEGTVDSLVERVRASRVATDTTGLVDPILDRGVMVEAPLLTVLFGSTSPRMESNDVGQLIQLVASADAGSPCALPDLSDVALDIQALELPDFEQGNVLAEEAHESLALSLDGPVDVERALVSAGVDVRAVTLSDRLIRGVTTLVQSGQAVCSINQSFRDGNADAVRRFTMAHELCHLLFDRTRARELAVVSGPWAPRSIERRANAFAAAFLMPVHLLEAAMAASEAEVASTQWIAEISNLAQTSAVATLQRLANLGVLSEEERESLSRQAARRKPWK